MKRFSSQQWAILSSLLNKGDGVSSSDLWHLFSGTRWEKKKSCAHSCGVLACAKMVTISGEVVSITKRGETLLNNKNLDALDAENRRIGKLMAQTASTAEERVMINKALRASNDSSKKDAQEEIDVEPMPTYPDYVVDGFAPFEADLDEMDLMMKAHGHKTIDEAAYELDDLAGSIMSAFGEALPDGEAALKGFNHYLKQTPYSEEVKGMSKSDRASRREWYKEQWEVDGIFAELGNKAWELDEQEGSGWYPGKYKDKGKVILPNGVTP